MDLILAKKRVLLLVSGGIAIYKSLDLISHLKKEGAEVFVAMSEEATRFIAPLTFEAMSGNKVLCRATESFPQISHISYANLADIAIIAPATINTIAKLNYGIADNLIVETLLACKCEVFIAPSANVNMLESPQNRANMDSLKNMGYKIIAPRTTLLACNVVANGAMAEVREIIFQLKRGVMENSSLGAPCGDFGNLGRFADAPVQSHAPNSQKTPQIPPQILELDSNKSDSSDSSLRGRIVDSHEAIQNTNQSARSANPCKSFCYFWLSPKVESPSPSNLPKGALSTQKDAEFANFWHNKNIIITGGGSVESIDSIRHISNDSSGKQASNLALAFYYLGANVSLIASKFPILLPLGVEKIAVKSSADFKNAVESKLNTLQENKKINKKDTSCGSIFDEKSGLRSHEQGNKTNGLLTKRVASLHDLSQKDNARNTILLMAAAISDFVPKQKAQGKLKKEQIGDAWDLHLTQNDDILKQISSKFGDCCYIVGFKAESFGEEITQEAIKTANQNAKKMLNSKGCDMVVLNIISKSNEIGGEYNEVRIFTAQNELKIPQDSKLNISFEIAKNIAQNLSKK